MEEEGVHKRPSQKTSSVPYGTFIEDLKHSSGFNTSSGLHSLGSDAPLVVLAILLFSLPLSTFGLQGELFVSCLALAYGVVLSFVLLAMSCGRPWRWALYSVGCLLSSFLGAVLGFNFRLEVPGSKRAVLVFASIVGYSVLSFLLQAFALRCGYPLRGTSKKFKDQNGWGWNEEAAVHMIHGVDHSGEAGFELIAEHKYPTFLADGFLKQRACWSGEPAPDYVFHLSNDHMFIGCILCHPANPFDRKERILALGILWLLIVFPVAVLTVTVTHQIAQPIVICLVVTVPRAVLKAILKKKVLLEDQAILEILKDDSKPDEIKKPDSVIHMEAVESAEESQYLFFFKCYLFAGAIAAGSCVYLHLRHELSSYLLFQSCTGIVYAIVLEFLYHLFGPYYSDEDWLHFGFFHHWWSQRFTYADEKFSTGSAGSNATDSDCA